MPHGSFTPSCGRVRSTSRTTAACHIRTFTAHAIVRGNSVVRYARKNSVRLRREDTITLDTSSTFDGSIDGNLIQIAVLVTENAARKMESIRPFAGPWPVVKHFRQFMERNPRPDPVPDAIWNLPAT